MPKTKKPAVEIRREDHPGHLDPKHAASLLAKANETRAHDDERAFVRPRDQRDGLAEELGREAVVAMTSAEDSLTDDRARDVDEERGGPFVVTRASEEFATGTDKSNPKHAKREPFPKA
ncbi:MAG: hypothetical protein ACHREM_04490 [Polyangiales bacterium]